MTSPSDKAPVTREELQKIEALFEACWRYGLAGRQWVIGILIRTGGAETFQCTDEEEDEIVQILAKINEACS